MDEIKLQPLLFEQRDDFIRRNQQAFMKAAVETFGPQEKEVISREDILRSLDDPKEEIFRILLNGQVVGGVSLCIDRETQYNSLDLLFLDPEIHSQNIGFRVWNMIETMYPKTKVWETHTPYFETRNIHFYVNKCGFQIVEFFNPKHPEKHTADTPGGEFFFRFEKHMK